MVGRGHKNYVQVLGMFLEHLPPVGVGRRLFPTFLAQHAVPPPLIDLGKAEAIQSHAMRLAGMRFGPATNRHEADVERLVGRTALGQSRQDERDGHADSAGLGKKFSTSRSLQHDGMNPGGVVGGMFAGKGGNRT